MAEKQQTADRLPQAAAPDGEVRGFRCPKCGGKLFAVVYTRPISDGIRRCRKCRNCGERLLTTER